MVVYNKTPFTEHSPYHQTLQEKTRWSLVVNVTYTDENLENLEIVNGNVFQH